MASKQRFETVERTRLQGLLKNLSKFSEKVVYWLMGCVLAAQVSGQNQGGKIQTCMIFFLHDPVKMQLLRY